MAMFPATSAALGMGGTVGTAVEVLQALQVDPAVIEQIAADLTQTQRMVSDGTPEGTGHTAFGESGAGGYCAHHTGKAEEHVVAAMTEMAESLAGFRTAIRRFAEGVEDADQLTRQDLQRHTDRIVGVGLGAQQPEGTP